MQQSFHTRVRCSATQLLGTVGRDALGVVARVGAQVLFLAQVLMRLPRPPWRWRSSLEQMYFIGNRSLTIVSLTAAFTGLVLALQGHTALDRFGAEPMVGALVALSLTRELAPVLGALMVTARAGSAMAATLGNMRVTEQVDALETLAIDPIDYLVKPRLVACVTMVPLLCAIFAVVGITVAQVFAEGALGMEPGLFRASVEDALRWEDVREGVVKSLVFALLIVWVASYRGYHARGGARGVGQATTMAVVETSVLVLGSDYVLTALLF